MLTSIQSASASLPHSKGSLHLHEDRMPEAAFGGVRLGVSAATERLRFQVRRLGSHFRTALVTGERGVRKEAVARALHAASPAAGMPFVVCGEKRLRAAADGAELQMCADLLKEAREGTIFISELGSLSAAAQACVVQLLDLVELRHVQRVRVIASLSESPQESASAGTLLARLRERLGAVELAVAPLRERLEEIEQIAASVLDGEAQLSGEALDELKRRSWPGNDRELESTLRLAMLASDGATIEAQDLPRAGASRTRAESPERTAMRLQEVIDAHVLDVMRRCDGNKLRAADALGVSRSTLYRMLEVATTPR